MFHSHAMATILVALFFLFKMLSLFCFRLFSCFRVQLAPRHIDRVNVFVDAFEKDI